jgi:hypothetical protein
MKHLNYLWTVLLVVAIVSCSNDKYLELGNSTGNAQTMQMSAVNGNDANIRNQSKERLALVNRLSKKLQKGGLTEAKAFLHDNYADIDSIIIERSKSTGDETYYLYSHSELGEPRGDVVTKRNVTNAEKKNVKDNKFTYKRAKDMERVYVID